MNYFETVAGHRFADVLESTLPRLVEALEERGKKQKSVLCENNVEVIEKVLKTFYKEDFLLKEKFESKEGVLLVFEK